MTTNVPNMVIGISFAQERSRMWDIIETMNKILTNLGGDNEFVDPINGIAVIYTWLFENIDKISKGHSINQESTDQSLWTISRELAKVFALQVCVYANLFEDESKLMVMGLLQDAFNYWINRIDPNPMMNTVRFPKFDEEGNLSFEHANQH